MKNLLVLALLLLNSILGNAQISLDKTYDYSTTVCELSDGNMYYYLMDVPQAQCRIYTTNHSLYKTINLALPMGYYLSDIQYVSSNLFNTDSFIELLFIYEKYTETASGYYFEYGLSVINENGTQLLNLPDGAWSEVKSINGKNKLLAYTYRYNTLGYYDVTTNIYSLGGAAAIIKPSGSENSLVYPNPASNYITLKSNELALATGGEFTLFSPQGQVVLKQVIHSSDEIYIPLNNLSAGAYLYTISKNSKRIQSSTIIIK